MDNATERRAKAVRKYFTKSPDKPSYIYEILLMALGGLGLFVSFIIAVVNLFKYATNSYETSPMLSLVLCATPIFIGGLIVGGNGGLKFWRKKSEYDKAYAIAEPKPSDQQMDKWLEQDKKKLIVDAMKKLELVPDQIVRPILHPDEPLLIIGPQMPTYIAAGKDGTLRFSRYEVVIIYLTRYHLGAYSCDLDFMTGMVLSEQTQEYHYVDVVSVSTTNENSPFNVTTVDNKVHPIASHQQFSLSVANGDRIKVTVAFPQLEGIFQEGKLLPSGAEMAISNLRAMLREKKGGSQVR
jgi:hypothetical protein